TSLFPCAEEACSEALLVDAGTGFKEGRLKPSFADNVGIRLAGARRLKPCPRQSRHCENGLLEQMSTLYCYKVKASACSGNQRFVAHSQIGQQLTIYIQVGKIIELCCTWFNQCKYKK